MMKMSAGIFPDSPVLLDLAVSLISILDITITLDEFGFLWAQLCRYLTAKHLENNH